MKNLLNYNEEFIVATVCIVALPTNVCKDFVCVYVYEENEK